MGDRAVSARDISRSVVVTGDGNLVRLAFGDSGIVLPLRRKQFPPPDRRRPPRASEPPRELDLLVAEAGRLPLVGRQDLLAELQAWLDDETDISVYGLIGRAGIGKTRLAIEFCRTIDSDSAGEGLWVTGFLSPSDLHEISKAFATRSFDWERQTLLVIDYAAQCHQALARWLDRLAEQKLNTKLRLLLLDREAPETFGWWHDLTVLGPPSRRDLFHKLRPRQLPDLSDLEERGDLMAAALQAARAIRPGASGGTPIPVKDADPDFDRRLGDAQFGNPLNLVMAGVIAVDRGPRAALALRRLDAARQIARRELRRLTDLAGGRQIDEGEMRHLVAFNSLASGLPVTGLRDVVADELQASRRSPDHLDALLSLLQQEFPPRGEPAEKSRISTIQPDLIDEAAIVEAFTGDPAREAEAAEVVRRSYALDGTAAAQALFRLIQDFAYPVEDPDAADEERSTGRRVMRWMLALAERIDEPDQLVPLVFSLPHETTILREPAAQLTRALADYFVEKAERDNDPLAVIYSATLLNDLSNRLSALGRREEALTAAKEAVRLRRALSAARPDAFIPDLAGSLTNLADRLSGLGRHEEALDAAAEAVSHYRALTVTCPDAFTANLAGSLNNLARALSDLGRREEALTAAAEAIGHYRALADARSDAFTADLALSLNNLTNTLSDLGRREEALDAALEAVGHYRALTAARPDAFTPNLAASLNNLANRLSALGRHEEALGMAEEAAGHYRALAVARPDAFTADLAGSLNNLANILSALGRREEALDAAEEAVGLRRALAAARPDAFTADLAGSLNNLANRLRAMGRHEEALGMAQEAVGLRRALAGARPEAFTPDLAGSLNNLAATLSGLGRREEALDAAEEAVGHYRALAVASPDTFTPNLALSLNNLAAMLSALGRRTEGLAAAEEAVGHYRALAAARPDAFAIVLARSLWVLGDLYGDAEKQTPAVDTLAEAVQVLTPILSDTPPSGGRDHGRDCAKLSCAVRGCGA